MDALKPERLATVSLKCPYCLTVTPNHHFLVSHCRKHHPSQEIPVTLPVQSTQQLKYGYLFCCFCEFNCLENKRRTMWCHLYRHTGESMPFFKEEEASLWYSFNGFSCSICYYTQFSKNHIELHINSKHTFATVVSTVLIKTYVTEPKDELNPSKLNEPSNSDVVSNSHDIDNSISGSDIFINTKADTDNCITSEERNEIPYDIDHANYLSNLNSSNLNSNLSVCVSDAIMQDHSQEVSFQSSSLCNIEKKNVDKPQLSENDENETSHLARVENNVMNESETKSDVFNEVIAADTLKFIDSDFTLFCDDLSEMYKINKNIATEENHIDCKIDESSVISLAKNDQLNNFINLSDTDTASSIENNIEDINDHVTSALFQQLSDTPLDNLEKIDKKSSEINSLEKQDTDFDKQSIDQFAKSDCIESICNESEVEHTGDKVISNSIIEKEVNSEKPFILPCKNNQLNQDKINVELEKSENINFSNSMTFPNSHTINSELTSNLQRDLNNELVKAHDLKEYSTEMASPTKKKETETGPFLSIKNMSVNLMEYVNKNIEGKKKFQTNVNKEIVCFNKSNSMDNNTNDKNEMDGFNVVIEDLITLSKFDNQESGTDINETEQPVKLSNDSEMVFMDSFKNNASDINQRENNIEKCYESQFANSAEEDLCVVIKKEPEDNFCDEYTDGHLSHSGSEIAMSQNLFENNHDKLFSFPNVLPSETLVKVEPSTPDAESHESNNENFYINNSVVSQFSDVGISPNSLTVFPSVYTPLDTIDVSHHADKLVIEKKVIKCQSCNYYCVDWNSLTNHFLKHSSSISFELLTIIENVINGTNIPTFVQNPYICGCEYCVFKTNCLNSFKSHFQTCHFDAKEFMCKHCLKICNTWRELCAHMRLHGPNLYKCKFCPYMHWRKGDVINHSKFHHHVDDNPIFIRSRSQCFKDKDKILTPKTNSHMLASTSSIFEIKSKLNEKRIKNTLYNKESNRNKTLVQATTSTSQDDIQNGENDEYIFVSTVLFRCKYCTYSSMIYINVVKHCKETHPNKVIEIIRKPSGGVKRKSIKHNSDSKIKKRFKQHMVEKDDGLVNVPVRVDNPYVCGYENCKKQTNSVSSLKLHVLSCHKNSNSFVCRHCSDTFTSGKEFCSHLRYHGPDIYKCNYCFFTYWRPNIVESHMQIKHKKNEKAIVIRSFSNFHIKKNKLSKKNTFPNSLSNDKHYRKVNSLNTSQRTRFIKGLYKCQYCPYTNEIHIPVIAHSRRFHPKQKPKAVRILDTNFLKLKDSQKGDLDYNSKLTEIAMSEKTPKKQLGLRDLKNIKGNTIYRDRKRKFGIDSLCENSFEDDVGDATPINEYSKDTVNISLYEQSYIKLKDVSVRLEALPLKDIL